jgi:hypothetical protein
MPSTLVPKSSIAAKHGVSTRTVHNWFMEGFITGYRLPGRREVLFDPDEVERAAQTNPHMRPTAKLFGPKARVVELPAGAAVVRRTPVRVEAVPVASVP